MLAVAVLAAGKGTRMKSSLPKVLMNLAGSTLIEKVLRSSEKLLPDRRLLIVGHKAELVQENLKHLNDLEFVLQSPQKGTGHAIQQLYGVLKDFRGELLVLNGDVPLLSQKTLENLVNQHKQFKASVTLLTARLEDPRGYGRVFIGDNQEVEKIIEDRDCEKDQLKNNLTNAGIYCFDWEKLQKVLPQLNSDNDQGEIYLTDTVAMLDKAHHIELLDLEEAKGVNDRVQLAQCEKIIQARLKDHWMREGVTFIDPSSCTLSEDCVLGKDIVIEPQTHLRGKCFIGNGCRIGPGSTLQNVEIGDRVSVMNSVITDSRIDNDVRIGPFAHLRPGSEISNGCRIGNFVEIKQSHLDEKVKVNHLSYIGDAQLGSHVNIGAGTITANYDGLNKHRTVIGDQTKTGANSVLVAPITLGKNVTVGAGSTLTRNVPDNSLAISRAKQLIKEGWSKIQRIKL